MYSAIQDTVCLFNLFILCTLFSNGLCVCSEHLRVKLPHPDPTSEVNFLKYGVNFTKEENYYIVNGTSYGCICNLKQCVRKCCGPNEIFNDNTRNCTIKENFVHNFTFHIGDAPISNFKSDNLHLIHGWTCPNSSMRIIIFPSEDESMYLQSNGSLLHSFDGTYDTLHVEHYCVEYFETETDLKYGAFRCFPLEDMLVEEEKMMVHKIGKFVHSLLLLYLLLFMIVFLLILIILILFLLLTSILCIVCEHRGLR